MAGGLACGVAERGCGDEEIRLTKLDGVLGVVTTSSLDTSTAYSLTSFIGCDMCKSLVDYSFDHRENKGIDLQKLAVVVTAWSILIQTHPSHARNSGS